MFEVRAATRINRPIEDVFAFIAENENDPRWCIPVIETTRIAGEQPGVGARHTFASKVGFIRLGGAFEITSFEPPASIGWKGTSPFGRYVGRYQLEREEHGVTRLEESVTFAYRGLWRVLESMHRRMFADSYARQLQRLQRLLEGTEA
jgi:hypothetical protein